jgi:hypothetical protein
MAYIINKYNTDQLAVVDDGTINTTLDIKLIGKNTAGYGEAQNENFVWLLENFARDSSPPRALIGQLWYNTQTQKLRVNYGANVWHTLGINDVVANKDSAVGLTQGDLFWITDQQQLWCKGATENVLIGGKLDNINTQMKHSTVDSNAVPPVQYDIIEAVINGVTTVVISSAATTFTLASGEALKVAGWSEINPGITVKGYESTHTTSPDYKYWGSATNSDGLGGLLASAYVTKSGATFSNIAKFSNAGFSVGPADNEILYVTNESSVPTIRNAVSPTIQFITTVSGSMTFPMKLVGKDIIPGTANTDGSNIGSSTYKFNNVYALSFQGNATTSSGLLINTTAYPASVSATLQTTAVRSATDEVISGYTLPAGSIKAVQMKADAFVGNASSASGLRLDNVTIVPTVSATLNTVVARSASDEVISGYTLPAGSIKAVQVKADVFVGNATSATGLVLSSNTIVPAITATANTVVVRTATSESVSLAGGGSHTLPAGSIKAVEVFASSVGTVLADLAEKYIADETYEVGTVVMIGGQEEVTAAVAGNRALGVVSNSPAYLMNITLSNGTPIALKGRVPVKVIGEVKKGDRLIASSEHGFAQVLTNSADAEYVFAIALSSNENNVVEAVIL